MSLALVHSATRSAVRKGYRLSHTQATPLPLAYDSAPDRNRPALARLDGGVQLVVKDLSIDAHQPAWGPNDRDPMLATDLHHNITTSPHVVMYTKTGPLTSAVTSLGYGES